MKFVTVPILGGVFEALLFLCQLHFLFGKQENPVIRRIKDAEKCRKQTKFDYVRILKSASTTLVTMFRRFGLLQELAIALPYKSKIYVILTTP
jgi:hypothetical protein